MDTLHSLSLSALALSLDSSLDRPLNSPVAVSPPEPRPAPQRRRSSRCPRRKPDSPKKTPPAPGDKGSLLDDDDSNKENEDPEGNTPPPPPLRQAFKRGFGLEIRYGLSVLANREERSPSPDNRFMRQRSKQEQPVLIYQDAF